MKVTDKTKRYKKVRKSCTHWFVATEMTQTGKRISGALDMPFYLPVFTLSGFKCCVCNATPNNAYNKLARANEN